MNTANDASDIGKSWWNTTFPILWKHTVNVLRWVALPLVLVVLYFQLFHGKDFNETINQFKSNLDQENWYYLLFVVLLMPVNLGIEALKWRKLVNPIVRISYKTSFIAIFTGIALSLFTPKRIGEYGGRVIALPNNKMAALVSTFVGNLGQMIINIIVGLSAIYLFMRRFPLNNQQITEAIPFIIVILLFLFAFYFNLEAAYNRLNKWKKVQKYSSYLSTIKVYKTFTLIEVLSLSFLKYVVFISQFVILIKLFGIDVPWVWGLVCASCVFFAKTMIPMPATAELALRGSIAIYFFSYLTQNNIGIALASILLWVINLALPALIGSYLLNRQKI